MVPSICPLETLHNSLSLKQVDDFLASIATSHDSLLEMSVCSPGKKKTKSNTVIFLIPKYFVFKIPVSLPFSVHCLSHSCSGKESSFEHIHSCKGFTMPFHSGCGKEVTRAPYIRHVEIIKMQDVEQKCYCISIRYIVKSKAVTGHGVRTLSNKHYT